MDFNYARHGAPGFRLYNLDNRTLGPERGRRGFPDWPERPCILFDKKLGTPPLDLEEMDHYWLVSDRTKAVFKTVDPEAFAFTACDVALPKAIYDGPPWWLCDVVRILDALDETQSRLRILRRGDPGYKYVGDKFYEIGGGAELVFREDVVGTAHVFRMAHREPTIICDDVLKNACKEAGLKGIKYKDALKTF